MKKERKKFNLYQDVYLQDDEVFNDIYKKKENKGSSLKEKRQTK
ncbi:hypothetical protein [Carboxydothermus pertinax]|uniref:Uncharacterized protein n=1 Tax=Carboxydothermus pertinax TaxID=870242 RepID=A0A1L8CXX2_9THEO|nr:hypothetical protein [Carboxydothermus pertinax]GAV23709.1 hypothetical protein cpu_22190 [Carboxydothermus pertinax]